MTEILPPTRSQLAEFISNHETVRRFEILFRMVGEDLPEAIASNSEAALSVANSALALINDLSRDLQNSIAAVESKVSFNSDAVKRLERDLEIMRYYTHAVNNL